MDFKMKNHLINNYYIIPSYSLNNNKLYIKNKSNLINNYLSKDEIIYKNKYEDLITKLNALQRIYEYYNLDKARLDYGSNYYYLKAKDKNKGEFGEYNKNVNKITKNKGNRTDKKNFKKIC